MYKEDSRSKLIPLLIAVVLTVGTALLLMFKFDLILESNDDITLRSIASGSFTGTPDAHLIYIMYPMGLLFKGLYTVARNVDWFDFFIAGMHFLCLLLILYRVGTLFKRFLNGLLGMIMALFMFVIFQSSFMVINQYTVLAAVIMATAVFWLTTADYDNRKKSDAAVIIILLLLALWLRKQVFFLGLPLVVLSLILYVFEKNDTYDERFDRFKHLLVPGGIFVVIILASFGIEFAAYSSDPWKEFKAFNAARTDVYDFDGLPDYYGNEDFYEGLGISEAEYTILREYDLVLLDDVDTETFKALNEKAGLLKKEWAKYYSVPRKVINDTVGAVYGLNNTPLSIALTILFFILTVFFMFRDKKLAGAVVIAAYVFRWLFIGYFTYLNRLPERVTRGFFLMEFLFLSAVFIRALLRTKNLREPSIYWEIVIGLFLLGIFAFTGLYAYRTTTDRLDAKMVNVREWSELNRYFKDNPENIYVVNTAVFAASGAQMFEEGAIDAHNTVTANWTLGGPLQTKRLEKLGITSVQETLRTSDNAFFVQKADKNVEWLEDYFGKAEVADTVTLSNGEEFNILTFK